MKILRFSKVHAVTLSICLPTFISRARKRGYQALVVMKLITPLLILFLLQCSLASQLRLKDAELTKCCHDIEYSPVMSDLVECVNVTLQRRVDNIISQIPYIEGRQGPRFALGIVTRATQNIYDYASYSLFVQSIYASKNNYALFPLYPDDMSTPDYQYHRKLVPLLNTMNSSNLGFHFDFLVWMDADVIPLDLGLRLESIASKHPKAHVLMSADVSSIANTGVILVRNTLWTKKFLTRWLTEKSVASTDQQGLQQLLQKMVGNEKDREKVIFLPPSVLNSEAPPMGRQLKEHKILHLAAESTDMRQRAFRVAADDICEVLNKVKKRTSRQLGLDRETLQDLSRVSYRFKAKDMLSKMIKNPDKYASLSKVNKLKMFISKYCHTIKYKNPGEREDEETLVLRRRLHLIVMYIVKKLMASSECNTSNDRRHENENDDLTEALFRRVRQLDVEASPTGDFLFPERKTSTSSTCVTKPKKLQYSQIPELLKISCEASYEYFHALASIDNQNTITPSFHDALFGEDSTTTHLDPAYMVDRENIHKNIITIRELRLSVAMYIQNQLQKLMEIVQNSQKNLVYDMKACLTSDIGLIKLEQGWVDDAIDAFKEAIKLHTILRNDVPTSPSTTSLMSPMGGDRRAEFNTYSLLGSAYCMKHEQVEGIQYLEQAINMEMEHVGNVHHNLATKLVNAAVCAFEGFKDLTEGRKDVDIKNQRNPESDELYFLKKSHKHISTALEVIAIHEHIQVVQDLKTMAQEHLREVDGALQSYTAQLDLER